MGSLDSSCRRANKPPLVSKSWGLGWTRNHPRRHVQDKLKNKDMGGPGLVGWSRDPAGLRIAGELPSGAVACCFIIRPRSENCPSAGAATCRFGEAGNIDMLWSSSLGKSGWIRRVAFGGRDTISEGFLISQSPLSGMHGLWYFVWSTCIQRPQRTMFIFNGGGETHLWLSAIVLLDVRVPRSGRESSRIKAGATAVELILFSLLQAQPLCGGVWYRHQRLVACSPYGALVIILINSRMLSAPAGPGHGAWLRHGRKSLDEFSASSRGMIALLGDLMTRTDLVSDVPGPARRRGQTAE